MLPATATALAKAAAAFAVAVLLARFLVRPLFDLVARSRNEEVFTAMALLVALAAGWATGEIGLSLTLGAFLGGMIIAETPYRAVIQSEIKPFRGLLLGFFFISVGLSLDPPPSRTPGRGCWWSPARSSWPRSRQRGREPGLPLVDPRLAAARVPAGPGLRVRLRDLQPVPAVRALLGEMLVAVLVAAVALSPGLTPNLAEAGRSLAGRLRRRRQTLDDPELRPRALAGPVLIVGMGRIGRTVADALIEFGSATAPSNATSAGSPRPTPTATPWRSATPAIPGSGSRSG